MVTRAHFNYQEQQQDECVQLQLDAALEARVWRRDERAEWRWHGAASKTTHTHTQNQTHTYMVIKCIFISLKKCLSFYLLKRTLNIDGDNY